jgi:hypothetical protein
MPPLQYVRAGEPARQHQKCEKDQPGQPLLQPLHPEKKKGAHDAQPARRPPGTDEPARERTQKAEHAAQPGEEHVAERREFSIGNLKHGSSPDVFVGAWQSAGDL